MKHSVSGSVFLLVSAFRWCYSIGDFPIYRIQSPEWISIDVFVASVNVIRDCFGKSGYWTVNFYFDPSRQALELTYHAAMPNRREESEEERERPDDHFDSTIFFRKHLKVDVNFHSDGWFCGVVDQFTEKQVHVVFKIDDPDKRLEPKENEIRLCRHRPQVAYATK